MRLKADFKQYHDCLLQLKTVIRYSYGQWLIEDPDNHDYKVVVSVTTENEPGYSIAHRTGIIGQVFRTKQSILASDLSNHPLYDPFDHTIGNIIPNNACFNKAKYKLQCAADDNSK